MRIPWLKLYVYLILFLLFVPLILIIIFSFNDNMLGTFPFVGFSLRWYQEAFSRPIYLMGFRYSAIVAVVSSIGAGILGTLAAYGLNRYKTRFSGLILGFLTVPILIPGLVLGISMLSYFYFLGINRSLVTVILAHIVFTTPYVILILNARFHNFDWAIEDAARDLGANTWQRIRLVLFPLIRPSIMGAMMLVFATSFDEFVVTFFVIGNQSTLPMIIWSMLKRGVSPTLNALSTILLLLSFVLLVLALRVFKVKIEL
ncbi:MAG: ABC transporter permease [Anaerolineales bacterium]|jgi:ABC-type spermidine/putrescine transport system permease subunit II|nr:ABC transporter permease [Anaerolineales bacterium]